MHLLSCPLTPGGLPNSPYVSDKQPGSLPRLCGSGDAALLVRTLSTVER